MAERAMRAAGFLPRHIVRVAIRVVPVGSRGRYRQEFLAELPGLTRTRQLRHAVGVLSRSWALRAALNTPSEAGDMELVFSRLRRPKRYSVQRTADGYEIRDAEAAGTKVFFSASRRAARGMSRALNARSRPHADDSWKRAYGGGGAGGGG